MYVSNINAREKATTGKKLFKYFQIVILLYLLFDTGMYLLEGRTFTTARTLHYIFTIFYFLVIPLPGFFYFLFCGYKVYLNPNTLKKRMFIFLIPVILNTILVLLTPLTNFIFYIDSHNIYMRGSFMWITMVISFGYVLASYPMLAIATRMKKSLAPAGHDLYLYLLPIPPLMLAAFQMLYYGPLLLGLGFVISAYFMYTNNVQSSVDRRRLADRFNNVIIMQFSVVFFIMTIGMFWTFDKLSAEISVDFAVYNSASTAKSLETYINREIGVLGTAAHSRAVINWFYDETNPEKKAAAFNELSGALQMLDHNNMYIVVNESGQEYSLTHESDFDDFESDTFVSGENPVDVWAFDLMASPQEYTLNVDVDKLLQRKKVWLNYKVINEKAVIGIICTGMELSKIAEQAFSRYDNEETRVVIIDEKGVICMDSAFANEDDFLVFGTEKKITDEVPYPDFTAAVHRHLEETNRYTREFRPPDSGDPLVIELQQGKYRYATITPIGTTDWSVVKLFESSSLFSLTRLLAPFAIISVLFILFAFNSNRITKRLIFAPLKQLVDSMLVLRENSGQDLYGLARNDEIGILSRTIHDLFVKGHYDGLTGIFNRRYMEITLRQITATLSRTKSNLTIMMVDIDFFKKYNDTYGHSQGDECLKAVSKALARAVVRKGDFAARYGGEEFAIIMPGTDEEGARLVAGKFLDVIRGLKIPHEKNEPGIVTISIGIATGEYSHTQSWEDYLKKADEALYMSKQSGRNKFTFLDYKENASTETKVVNNPVGY